MLNLLIVVLLVLFALALVGHVAIYGSGLLLVLAIVAIVLSFSAGRRVP